MKRFQSDCAMNSPDHEKLERLVHATLRALPARQAPASLENRVLAEIERRARLPWWTKSFRSWPMPARMTFGVVSLGLVVATAWVLGGFEAGQLTGAFTPHFAWLESITSVFGAIGGFFAIMFRSIPPVWFYGSLVFFAAMYVALFGLGAAAYRTLYANR
jgi:hypothetical protein